MPAAVIGAVPPADGAGRKDERHPVVGSKDQLVQRLKGADQRRQRLAVMDIVGPFLKGFLPAGLGDGDFVDACRVKSVVGPGDDRFAGVGEHPGEFVERPQFVVYVADGAQRLAKVDVGQGVAHLGHHGRHRT